MISKKSLKSGKVKVCFELPAEFEADEVFLIADFSDWQVVAFKRLKKGWKLEQTLESGKSYQFRYKVIKGNEVFYLNDEMADAYIANPHGSDNAILET